MISDVVAERLVQLRKDARLSREELAERCRQLGDSDFTAAALTNIETGRRDSTGRRRRKITIDELAVFAAALDVPLVWLLADPKSDDRVQVLANVSVDPWSALLWMIGKKPLTDKPGSAWFDAEAALHTADEVRKLSDLLESMRDSQRQQAELLGKPNDEGFAESARGVLDQIATRLEHLKRWGYRCPQLPAYVVERAAELDIELPGLEA